MSVQKSQRFIEDYLQGIPYLVPFKGKGKSNAVRILDLTTHRVYCSYESGWIQVQTVDMDLQLVGYQCGIKITSHHGAYLRRRILRARTVGLSYLNEYGQPGQSGYNKKVIQQFACKNPFGATTLFSSL